MGWERASIRGSPYLCHRKKELNFRIVVVIGRAALWKNSGFEEIYCALRESGLRTDQCEWEDAFRRKLIIRKVS
jgi:hypothetical protein